VLPLEGDGAMDHEEGDGVMDHEEGDGVMDHEEGDGAMDHEEAIRKTSVNLTDHQKWGAYFALEVIERKDGKVQKKTRSSWQAS
jgi:hypothetical protein